MPLLSGQKAVATGSATRRQNRLSANPTVQWAMPPFVPLPIRFCIVLRRQRRGISPPVSVINTIDHYCLHSAVIRPNKRVSRVIRAQKGQQACRSQDDGYK
nr:hypothetical protein PJ912_00610 [Pectobacterium colocasium]